MHLTALATARARLRKISSVICICLLSKSENEAMIQQSEAAKVDARMRHVKCVNDQTKTIDPYQLAEMRKTEFSFLLID